MPALSCDFQGPELCRIIIQCYCLWQSTAQLLLPA